MNKLTLITESSNRIHIALSFEEEGNNVTFNPKIFAKDIEYQLPKLSRDRNFFLSNTVEALMQNALNFAIGYNFEIPAESENSFKKSLFQKLCIFDASMYSKFLSELFDSLLEICLIHKDDESFTDFFSKIYIASLGAFINNLPEQSQNSNFTEYSGNVVQIICNCCELGSRLTISGFSSLFDSSAATFNTNDLFCLTELTDFAANKQNDKLLLAGLAESYANLLDKLPKALKEKVGTNTKGLKTEKDVAQAFKNLYSLTIEELNNSNWNGLAKEPDFSKIIDFIDYNPKLAIDASGLKVAFINQTTIFEALASIKSESKEDFEKAQKSIFTGIGKLVPIYSV